LGQHQAEVLKEFGLSAEEIEAVTPKIQPAKAGH
jgi:crotonobetainyl-CoA:carnitine CoA-transferase CaiB-like acyl-CoA transferase